MLDDWEESTSSIRMTIEYKDILKIAKRNLKRLMDVAVPCKKEIHEQQETGCGGDCISQSQGSKNHLSLKSGIPRIHKATSGTFPT